MCFRYLSTASSTLPPRWSPVRSNAVGQIGSETDVRILIPRMANEASVLLTSWASRNLRCPFIARTLESTTANHIKNQNKVRRTESFSLDAYVRTRARFQIMMIPFPLIYHLGRHFCAIGIYGKHCVRSNCLNKLGVR